LPGRTPNMNLVTDCYEAAQQVFAIMARASDSEWLSLNVTMGQFKAMMTVAMFGPQPVGELGRHLGLSEPAASLLADKLEEHGLAVRERDPEDGRRSLVTLTPEAVELAATLRQGRTEQLERLFGALEKEELEGLIRGFRGLLRVAGAEDAAATSAGDPWALPDAEAHVG
jgi:MarR family transcriptional regulator, organic hydroperoxide resistance regulator